MGFFDVPLSPSMLDTSGFLFFQRYNPAAVCTVLCCSLTTVVVGVARNPVEVVDKGAAGHNFAQEEHH